MSTYGIVINTNDPETAWNAVRLGITSINEGHKAKIFLLSKGVEIEDIHHEKFDVVNKIGEFAGKGGEVLACGTCLGLRNRKDDYTLGSSSTMKELVKLIDESDKVLIF